VLKIDLSNKVQIAQIAQINFRAATKNNILKAQFTNAQSLSKISLLYQALKTSR
jgi:hypothetical protein